MERVDYCVYIAETLDACLVRDTHTVLDDDHRDGFKTAHTKELADVPR